MALADERQPWDCQHGSPIGLHSVTPPALGLVKRQIEASRNKKSAAQIARATPLCRFEFSARFPSPKAAGSNDSFGRLFVCAARERAAVADCVLRVALGVETNGAQR
ncbi:hypothetical protein TARUN_155 [Trichoderma arundinaceum]|uniref:Uncharacterized protein n=1 Tax=Trichoderma arundinaceum TaxID=490622 RepID=A0A395P139_TRIAR|nr:hypothetical protein TARUN_155 [Trichoderma arundinaceum]